METSGICIAGKDTGDGSACTQATSNLLQAIIEMTSQAGTQQFSVLQVQALMLAYSNNPTVAATCAQQYQNWLKLAGFADGSTPVVIPPPLFTMRTPAVTSEPIAAPLAPNPWGFTNG